MNRPEGWEWMPETKGDTFDIDAWARARRVAERKLAERHAAEYVNLRRLAWQAETRRYTA